jgi:hypothetical protein
LWSQNKLKSGYFKDTKLLWLYLWIQRICVISDAIFVT